MKKKKNDSLLKQPSKESSKKYKSFKNKQPSEDACQKFISNSDPKLILKDFETDYANRHLESYKRGAKSIKIREDLYSDLINIKNI